MSSYSIKIKLTSFAVFLISLRPDVWLPFFARYSLELGTAKVLNRGLPSEEFSIVLAIFTSNSSENMGNKRSAIVVIPPASTVSTKDR